MMARGKRIIPNRLCENCGLALGNRYFTTKYCLRKLCRTEVNKRNAKNSIERKKRLRNGSGY